MLLEHADTDTGIATLADAQATDHVNGPKTKKDGALLGLDLPPGTGAHRLHVEPQIMDATTCYTQQMEP